jgi:hypothetical protein
MRVVNSTSSRLVEMTRTAVLTALYPAAFGWAYVLLSFATFPTPTADLIRPMVAVLLLSLLLVIGFSLLLRGIFKGGGRRERRPRPRQWTTGSTPPSNIRSSRTASLEVC